MLVEKRLGQRRPELTDEIYQTWREVEQRGLKETAEYRNVLLRADRHIKSAACGTPSGSSVEVPTLCLNVGRRGCPKADLSFRDEAANDRKAHARPPATQTPEAYRCCGLTLIVSKGS